MRYLFFMLMMTFAQIAYGQEVSNEPTPTPPYRISISKQTMELTLYDANDIVIKTYPIACGKNLGNKVKSGDMRTPEGVFTVQEIVNSSHWQHDFNDGKGMIAGAYGPYFIRLLTPPHRGIGIHGTHDDASIGTRATEGCIRMHNSDLCELKPYIAVGMTVEILTSEADQAAMK